MSWSHIPKEPGWYWCAEGSVVRVALVLRGGSGPRSAPNVRVYDGDGEMKQWNLQDLPLTTQWLRIEKPERPGRWM